MIVRSKHNNLLNYFIYDKKDLSKEYIKKCEKYLKEISNKVKSNGGITYENTNKGH